MLRPFLRAVAVASVLGPPVAAAPASAAPTLAPLKACNRYVPALAGKRYVPIVGAEWSPYEALRFAYRGDAAGTATAYPSGVVLDRVRPPRAFVRSRALEGVYTLHARSTTDPTHVARARVRMVRLAVRTPRRARPRSRVLYELAGFPDRTRVWAHYVFGGHRRATSYLGRTSGRCGRLRHRQRYLPARVRYGTWRVYFSNHRRFSARNYVLRGTFRVFRTTARRTGAVAR